eukprot:3871675-Rhodomonas_salina.1
MIARVQRMGPQEAERLKRRLRRRLEIEQELSGLGHDLQPSTLDPRLLTLYSRPSTPQPETLDPQPATLNRRPSLLNGRSSAARFRAVKKGGKEKEKKGWASEKGHGQRATGQTPANGHARSSGEGGAGGEKGKEDGALPAVRGVASEHSSAWRPRGAVCGAGSI